MKMQWRVLLSGLTTLLVVLTATPAAAIILYLKDQAQPVSGYFVRENERVIVLQELLPDGTTTLRTVPRTDIEDIIRSVSDERLAALGPDMPNDYRNYAEELSEKRKDPDARIAAMRLFLIAAYLDADRLGRSCLLGMIPLARSPAEQRRFRAMAYLLDKSHDAELLKEPAAAANRSSEIAPEKAELVLKALRLLRKGKKREAEIQARRADLREQLPVMTDTITYDEFATACEATCPHCTQGRQPCPTCKEKKFVLRGVTRVPCTTCGTRGTVPCPVCHGQNEANPLSPSLLKRILQLELAWLPGDVGAAGVAPAIRPLWSRTLQREELAACLPLTLTTLTEFDPRMCHYRDGAWTE